MTTAQLLSMLIAPIGALVMAVVVLFITRRDRAPETKGPVTKREALPKQSH
jgi:hypothetical protein